MKIKDLVVGTVYAVGSGQSEWLTDTGMLLSTDFYESLGRYWRQGEKFRPAPNPLGKYSTKSRGLPMACINSYASTKHVKELGKVDRDKIQFVPQEQTIDGVKLQVKIIQPRMILMPWTDWNTQQKQVEKSRAAARVAEERRREEREKTIVVLKKRCAELGLPVPYAYTSGDKVEFFRMDELLAALDTLQRKS